MKTISRIVLLLLIVATCFLSFSICCFAEASNAVSGINKFPSHTVCEPKMDIQSLLAEKVSPEIVDKQYQVFSVEKPKQYTYDTSMILVEYSVSTKYWSSISNTDYAGLTDAIDMNRSYPTLYIPLLGEVADLNGNMQTRVIGDIKLGYNYVEKDYTLRMGIYNLTSVAFIEREQIWYHETISDYLQQNRIVAEQVFLIRHPNSLSEYGETIAVIKTKDDTMILDISDSLHLTSSVDDPAVAYTIEEYRTRRLEVEKELYKTVDRWEDVQYGGNGASSNQNQSKNSTEKWVAGILCVSLAAGIITFGLMKKRLNSRH